MSDIDQRVRQVAADVFGTSPEKITADSSPQTIDTWDSVQHLNLVLALEQEMNVRIDPEEIERMKTIGDVIELVKEKTGS
jgi:acyl carrier protein